MIEESSLVEQKPKFLSKEIFKPNPDIKVVMEAGKYYSSFKEFCGQTEPGSIALDGMIRGASTIDTGLWRNIDHHYKTDPLITPSTAAQIHEKLTNGSDLLEIVKKIYGNHCDEDMSLSIFLFKYANIPDIINHPLISRLIKINDNLDRRGGLYPYPSESQELKEISWVIAPYQNFMFEGGMARAYSSVEERNQIYLKVTEQVEGRIIRYLTGEAQNEIRQFQPDTSFNKVYEDKENKWVLVNKLGVQGRVGMANAGIGAYIYIKPNGENNEKFYYSIGKSPEFGKDFNISELYKLYNEAEGSSVTETNRWGGSEGNGGSPPEGSILSPDKIIAITKSSYNKK